MNSPVNNDKVPLAPFNQLTAAELARLALLLSKGRNPEKFFPQAAALWAEAYQYLELLQDHFWGEDRLRLPELTVVSLGPRDQWLTVKQACAKHSCGSEHLRELLRETLPPRLFEKLWVPPIASIVLPVSILDKIERIRSSRRKRRSTRPVKSKSPDLGQRPSE